MKGQPTDSGQNRLRSGSRCNPAIGAMTPNPPSPDAVHLLGQTEWIRGLARRLVADPNDADDLAQDVLVAALERPPGTGAGSRGLRAFLRATLRNLVRLRLRQAAHRRDRERHAARAESLSSTADNAGLLTYPRRRAFAAVSRRLGAAYFVDRCVPLARRAAQARWSGKHVPVHSEDGTLQE